MEHRNLNDRVIVITGSTRGIGRLLAEACAACGAKVVVSSCKEESVREALSDLQAKGYTVSGIPCDVSQPDNLEQLLARALSLWGQVDVWINNAGLSGGMRFLEDMEPIEIADIVNTNITGLLTGSRLALTQFRKQGYGTLVNISGLGGKGEAAPYSAVYAATKAAVSSITRSLSKEKRGPGFSVFAVIPGMVATDFFRDMKVSPSLKKRNEGMPYVLDALALPASSVGQRIAKLIALPPEKTNGRIFSLLRGMRLMKGIFKLIRYRWQGKIRF
jgi:NAD(P)-dependent dehydrogenase (short-subunit alcohol dehydrogenase family)